MMRRSIHLFSTFQRCFSKKIGESSLILQDGVGMAELPIPILKSSNQEPRIVEIDCEEEESLINCFSTCTTENDVLRFLSTIEAVSPRAAVAVLRRLTDHPSSFARDALLKKLVTVVASSRDPNLMVDALELVDKSSEESNLLCETLHIRVVEGSEKVSTVGNAMKTLFFHGHQRLADELWTALPPTINTNDLIALSQSLPHLSKSRSYVLNMIERRILDRWRILKPTEISQIIELLRNHRPTHRLLCALTRALSIHLHRTTEEDLLKITRSFTDLSFVDESFFNSIRKWSVARGRTGDWRVVSSLLKYAAQERLREDELLSASADIFISLWKNGQAGAEEAISLLTPLGQLSYCSLKPEFWTAAENTVELERKNISPSSLLDLLLSFVYVKKYPLNLSPALFTPYFIHSLFSSQSSEAGSLRVRNRLQLLDTSLWLECGMKWTRRLPKNGVRRSWIDGRILASREILSKAVSGEVGVGMPSVPKSSLHVVDVEWKEDGKKVWALMHPPEHYCRDGQIFVGMQMLRARHARILNETVLHFDAEEVLRAKSEPRLMKGIIERTFELSHYQTADMFL